MTPTKAMMISSTVYTTQPAEQHDYNNTYVRTYVCTYVRTYVQAINQETYPILCRLFGSPHTSTTQPDGGYYAFDMKGKVKKLYSGTSLLWTPLGQEMCCH